MDGSCEGGAGEGVRESLRVRRKVTLEPNFPKTFILSFSLGTASTGTVSFPFPLTVFAVTVPKSSRSEGRAFFERVAVRMLWPREARRLKVLAEVSSDGDADERGGERGDDAI